MHVSPLYPIVLDHDIDSNTVFTINNNILLIITILFGNEWTYIVAIACI